MSDEPFSYAGERVDRFDRAFLWHYRAKWLSDDYLDGDTFTVLVDTGFRGREEVRVRLPGITAPERNTEAGRLAAGQLYSALLHADPRAKWNLRIITRQLVTKPDESTTFERYVADTYLVDWRTDMLRSLEAQLLAIQAEQQAARP
jgi:hypothetical protein